MLPPAALLVLQGIQMAIQAAPQVMELAQKGRELFQAMFTAKLITIEQQAELHRRIDEIQLAFAGGQIPIAWQVEPDEP